MALLDNDHHVRRPREGEATKHPGICLAGFVATLLGCALLVHLVFTALI